ncbi:MAG: hypothetical protein NVS3B1_12640 [Marmoricola sp.]
MATKPKADTRIRRAKATLAKGVKEAAEATTDTEMSRSTASRTAYKAKAAAADRALEILSEKV